MSEPRPGAVWCLNPHGQHTTRWVEWGKPDNPRALVCLHGLTRSGRDFDTLATALSGDYRVLCPDLAGRGASDWLSDGADYTPDQYCADMLRVLEAAGVSAVDWVGTSLGGIVGMMLAARPDGPIRRLVLNDVGCAIPRAALERIRMYVGKPVAFASLEHLEAAMRAVSPFGELSPGQWRHLAGNVGRLGDDGLWRFHYDPAIAQNFGAGPAVDLDLRALWQALKGLVLVLRGAESDLLTRPTFDEMLSRPGTSGIEVSRCGHAPALMDAAQVGAVREFLLS